MAASVVDLPLPVGPVTRTRPSVRVVERKDFHRDLPEDRRLAPVVAEKIATEAGETGHLIGEIEVVALEKFSPAFFGTDFL
jgi:hypothetical protein